MNNKRGFTLVELLTTIAILGIVLAVAVSTTVGIYNLVKKKALEEKITCQLIILYSVKNFSN